MEEKLLEALTELNNNFGIVNSTMVNVNENVINLQKSIDRFIDSNKMNIVEQKQLFETLKEQSLTSALPVVTNDFTPELPVKNLQIKSKSIEIDVQELEVPIKIGEIPKLSLEKSFLEIQLKYGDLPKLPEMSLEIPVNFKYQEFKKELSNDRAIEIPIKYVEDLKFRDFISKIDTEVQVQIEVPKKIDLPEFGMQEIPVKYAELPKIGDFPKLPIQEIPIKYMDLKDTVELPEIKSQVIPLKYGEIPDLKDFFEIKPIEIPLTFEKIKKLPELPKISLIYDELPQTPKFEKIQPQIIPLEYGKLPELQNIQKSLTQEIKLVYGEKPNLPQFDEPVTMKVKLDYDLERPNIDLSDIKPIKLSFEQLELKPLKVELDLPDDKNIINLREVQNLSLKKLSDQFENYNEKLELSKSKLETLGSGFSENLLIIKNAISDFSKEQINTDSIDLLSKKITSLNSIQFDENFTTTINNISESLRPLIAQIQELENVQSINTGFEQLSENLNKFQDTVNNLNTNLNFEKIRSINQMSGDVMMMSTMDKNQFGTLLNAIESKSNVAQIGNAQSETIVSPTTPQNAAVSIGPENKVESSVDTNSDLLEVMSSLDQKMTLMVSALNNIVNDGRSSRGSMIRPYRN